MAYTFDKANADKPTTHKTQYFEMMGVRGIYHEGWYACTTPIRPAWVTAAVRSFKIRQPPSSGNSTT